MSDLRQHVIALIEQLNPEQLLAVKEFVWKLNGLEDALFHLACRFRNTRDDNERKQVAKEYAEVVDKLVATCNWHESPAPDAQLPNEYMPKAYWDYWLDENLSRGMPG